jgi:hypothetical protein
MGPDTQLNSGPGLFDDECLVDFTGGSAEISRMITIYRWLRVLPPAPTIPCTTTDEPERVYLTLAGDLSMHLTAVSQNPSPAPLHRENVDLTRLRTERLSGEKSKGRER